MDIKKLMTFDEYSLSNKPSPYKFIFEKNGRHIFYFGSSHSFDPENKQFDQIKAFWQDFLNKTEDQKKIAFEEGGRRPFIENQNEAILKHGEMGFLVHLVTKAEVELFSPEPPERLRFEELSKKFNQEEIAYHSFANVCYQWNNMKEKPDFDKYINYYLKHDKEESGWKDFEFSILHMADIQKKLFGTEFDKNNKKFFYDVINPAENKYITNRISRYEGEEFRDVYILKQIEKYWNDGFNIFILYGSGHAICQEPAIRTL